jgi:hypothetical protein
MSKLQESCCPLQKKGSTGKERLTYYNHVKTNMNPSRENHAVIKNLNHYWLFSKRDEANIFQTISSKRKRCNISDSSINSSLIFVANIFFLLIGYMQLIEIGGQKFQIIGSNRIRSQLI